MAKVPQTRIEIITTTKTLPDGTIEKSNIYIPQVKGWFFWFNLWELQSKRIIDPTIDGILYARFNNIKYAQDLIDRYLIKLSSKSECNVSTVTYP